MPDGPGVVLGSRVGPFHGCLDTDLVRAYAAATDDPSANARAGQAVPSIAIVTQIWDAQNTARAELVPEALQRSATGGLHGEHDVVLHRPLVPGEPLRTWVNGHGSRTAGSNSIVTLRYATVDADETLVAEQWWSTVYLGTTCDRVGEPPSEHAFPEAARHQLVGTYEIDIDVATARRYADVSGDWSPHHFETEAARRSGFDRPFLHGLCTMALCAQGIVDLVASGDPDRIRRIAVRFATPAFLGESLVVSLYDAGALGFAFEAHSAGAAVITGGRAELR